MQLVESVLMPFFGVCKGSADQLSELSVRWFKLGICQLCIHRGDPSVIGCRCKPKLAACRVLLNALTSRSVDHHHLLADLVTVLRCVLFQFWVPCFRAFAHAIVRSIDVLPRGNGMSLQWSS